MGEEDASQNVRIGRREIGYFPDVPFDLPVWKGRIAIHDKVYTIDHCPPDTRRALEYYRIACGHPHQSDDDQGNTTHLLALYDAAGEPSGSIILGEHEARSSLRFQSHREAIAAIGQSVPGGMTDEELNAFLTEIHDSTDGFAGRFMIDGRRHSFASLQGMLDAFRQYYMAHASGQKDGSDSGHVQRDTTQDPILPSGERRTHHSQQRFRRQFNTDRTTAEAVVEEVQRRQKEIATWVEPLDVPVRNGTAYPPDDEVITSANIWHIEQCPPGAVRMREVNRHIRDDGSYHTTIQRGDLRAYAAYPMITGRLFELLDENDQAVGTVISRQERDETYRAVSLREGIEQFEGPLPRVIT